MWGMTAPTVEDAGRACRAWVDGAQQMQAEAVEFFNGRVGKDMAMLSELAKCTTPTEAFEVETRYGSEALSDYVAESQRMMALFGHAVPVVMKHAK